jgi:hypothetical protein
MDCNDKRFKYVISPFSVINKDIKRPDFEEKIRRDTDFYDEEYFKNKKQARITLYFSGHGDVLSSDPTLEKNDRKGDGYLCLGSGQ